MMRSRLLACVVALALSGGLAGCGSLAEKAGGDALGSGGSGEGGLAVDPTDEGGALTPDGTAAGPGTEGGGTSAGGTTGGPGSSGGSTGSTGSTGSAGGTSGSAGSG